MYACGVPGPERRSVPRGEVSQQCGWGFHGEILWGKLAGKGRYDRDGSPGRNRSSGRVPARRSPAETPRAAAPRTTPSPCLLPGAARRARPAPLLPATPPARSPQSGVPCRAVPTRGAEPHRPQPLRARLHAAGTARPRSPRPGAAGRPSPGEPRRCQGSAAAAAARRGPSAVARRAQHLRGSARSGGTRPRSPLRPPRPAPRLVRSVRSGRAGARPALRL